MFNKILYIGSKDDFLPLDQFPSSQFVYIDSLPRNEYGYPYYYRGFYRKHFKQQVIDKLQSISFEKEDEKTFTDQYSEINVPDLDSHVITFMRNEQRLRYYFSTGIPENLYNDHGYLNQELCNDISECDAILVKGHWPHLDVIKYIDKTKPFHFIGANPTYFLPDYKEEGKTETEDIKYTVLYPILTNCLECSSYAYLDASGNLSTFPTYSTFYNHYKRL
jgi:hypothetical protein